MKIAVIAATGRTGRQFVAKALANGHSIIAGVHSPTSNRLAAHPNLHTLPCDATDETQLRSLVANADAVVSFIGHTKASGPWVQTDATATLIRILSHVGPRRVVSLTGTGVRQPGDHIPLIDYLLNHAVRLIDPARLQDGIRHAELLAASDLDWTIIRVLKLGNGRKRGFRLTRHGPTKWLTSRTEAAAACLEVLQKESYKKAMPIVSRSSKN